MLTLELALTHTEFWHVSAKNADKTPARTAPGCEPPEKWCVPERWEAEHVLFAP